MSKLIYAISSNLLQTNYANILKAVTNLSSADYNPVYYSIAFTGDGYLYTHGKKFRLYEVGGNEIKGLGLGWNNGELKLLDGSTVLGTALAVQSLALATGEAALSLTTATSGTTQYILSHVKPLNLTAATYGGTISNSDNFNIPIITIDAYGHITAASNSALDVSKVKASEILNTDSANYYLIGVTNGDLQSPKYKSVHIDKNGDLYIGSNKAVTFNDKASDSTFGIVELYDGIDGGATTTNNVTTYLNKDGLKAATPYAVYLALEAAKAHALTLFASNDAMILAGTVNHSGVISSPNTAVLGSNLASNTTVALIDYKSGYTFKITDSGNLTIGSGANAVTFAVEAGDILLCVNDKTGGTAKGSDFTVIQNNIDGALYSSENLTGVVFGTGSRQLSALANPASNVTGFLKATGDTLSWESKENLWRTFYNGSASGDSISNKNIILQTSIGTNTTNPLEITFDTTGTNAIIKYLIDKSKILNAATSLTLTLNTTSFEYNPSGDAKTLTIGNGLSLSSVNSVYTLDHKSYSAINGTLGAVTVDAYGHVTGIDPIKKLYIGKIGDSYSANNFTTYDGSVDLGISISGGTDVTINTSSKTDSNGIFYDSTHHVAGLDFLIGITHKYRPISYTNDGNNKVSLLTDASNGVFKVIAGTNISLSGEANSGNLTINATNTWRQINAFAISTGSRTNDTLTSGSIGQDILAFSNDFAGVSSNEITTVSLVWTEIDGSGNVTYSV